MMLMLSKQNLLVKGCEFFGWCSLGWMLQNFHTTCISDVFLGPYWGGKERLGNSVMKPEKHRPVSQFSVFLEPDFVSLILEPMFSVGSRYLLEKVRVTKIDKQESAATTNSWAKWFMLAVSPMLRIPYERDEMPEIWVNQTYLKYKTSGYFLVDSWLCFNESCTKTIFRCKPSSLSRAWHQTWRG